jgi:hypothetical protein
VGWLWPRRGGARSAQLKWQAAVRDLEKVAEALPGNAKAAAQLQTARDALAAEAATQRAQRAAAHAAAAAAREAKQVIHLCACIGSPCLRQCVHGASIGGPGDEAPGGGGGAAGGGRGAGLKERGRATAGGRSTAQAGGGEVRLHPSARCESVGAQQLLCGLVAASVSAGRRLLTAVHPRMHAWLQVLEAEDGRDGSAVPVRAGQAAAAGSGEAGESFLRVHWIAVPMAMRARRVNRRQRRPPRWLRARPPGGLSRAVAAAAAAAAAGRSRGTS